MLSAQPSQSQLAQVQVNNEDDVSLNNNRRMVLNFGEKSDEDELPPEVIVPPK